MGAPVPRAIGTVLHLAQQALQQTRNNRPRVGIQSRGIDNTDAQQYARAQIGVVGRVGLHRESHSVDEAAAVQEAGWTGAIAEAVKAVLISLHVDHDEREEGLPGRMMHLGTVAMLTVLSLSPLQTDDCKTIGRLVRQTVDLVLDRRIFGNYQNSTVWCIS